jgi:hypothetical protein
LFVLALVNVKRAGGTLSDVMDRLSGRMPTPSPPSIRQRCATSACAHGSECEDGSGMPSDETDGAVIIIDDD